MCTPLCNAQITGQDGVRPTVPTTSFGTATEPTVVLRKSSVRQAIHARIAMKTKDLPSQSVCDIRRQYADFSSWAPQEFCPARCRSPKFETAAGLLFSGCRRFCGRESVKLPEVQHGSTSRPQTLQHQTLRIDRNPWISTGAGLPTNTYYRAGAFRLASTNRKSLYLSCTNNAFAVSRCRNL
jgi:hypothetical protein